METTSQPLKIHCSEGFKLILDKLGGYVLLERGMIEIKGKGDMKTYWLVDSMHEPRHLSSPKSYSNFGSIESCIERTY